MFKKSKTNPLLPSLVLVLITLIAFFYYKDVASGTPLRFLTALIPVKETKIGSISIGKIENPSYVITGSNESPNYPIQSEIINPEAAVAGDPLLKTALGLDFFSVSTQGKIFRIVQISILALTILGVLVALRKKKPFPLEYLGLAFIGGSTLVACLIVPGFSLILNPTRWYHLSLFFLSPMALVGWDYLFKDSKRFFLVLLIPYFLLTSGIVFEVTDMVRIDKADTPYNVSLSDSRIDISGHYTIDDLKVREWIGLNRLDYIYSDLYGLLFLQEELALEKNIYFIPYNGTPPKGSYVFLRAYSEKTSQITIWSGPGSRKVFPIQFEGEVVWQSGQSKLIKVLG